MALSKKEKINKFIEGAKLTGTASLITGSPKHEYINTVGKKYGFERWIYYATVAALGSVIVKKSSEFEKEIKLDLVDSYKKAIADEWDENTLYQIDELVNFILSRDTSGKEKYYESIGVWVIEKVTGTTIDLKKTETAQWVGWYVMTNMEMFMPFVKFSKFDFVVTLRWILFFPAAFVIAVLVGGLTNFSAQLLLPEWVSWSISGAFSGTAFVISGLHIAPRKTKFVKWMLVTIVGVIGLLSAVGGLLGDHINSVFAGIIILLIAISFASKPIDKILKIKPP